MNDLQNKIELLAPAGSPDSLKAAVVNGADAVYLGLSDFNARKNAVNFSIENFRNAVEFCHVRSVKVYLALNTLIYDDELKRAYETACFAYKNGVDALIVQDMGLAEILKKEIPDISLHISTQCGIIDADGVNFMRERGFSRIVLAREANFETIKQASLLDIEIEVFVHGARCYSYSGQCLMSSMLGGRSGNRGECAQPCRLSYSIETNSGRHLQNGCVLSLKDLSYLDYLSELKAAGVKSLKIEGRMKGPKYVACTVGIYRKYLDMGKDYVVSAEDRHELLKAFNRNGFSAGKTEFSLASSSNSGAPVGKVISSIHGGTHIAFDYDIDKSDGLRIGTKGCYAGKDIESGSTSFLSLPGTAGEIVYRTKDVKFAKKQLATLNKNEYKKIPIVASAIIRYGMNPIFKIMDDDGNIASASGRHLIQRADKIGTEISRIQKQLVKTGGTPYEITKLDLDCDKGIYIKISDINEMRRNAFVNLNNIRKGPLLNYECNSFTFMKSLPITIKKKCISICFYRIPENLDFSKLHVERIYVESSLDDELLNNMRSECAKHNIGFYLHIPFSSEKPPSAKCDGYLVENHNMLSLLPSCKIVAGTGLNICNSYTLSFYGKYKAATLSPELDASHIYRLITAVGNDIEMIVYGKLQVMESVHCPAVNVCEGGLCSKDNLLLKDRKNEKWEVLTDRHSHNVRIFNPHNLMLLNFTDELSEAGVSVMRLNILNETADEIYKIIEACKSGVRPFMKNISKFTRGRY